LTDNYFAANIAAAAHTRFCSKISRAIRRIGTKTSFAIAEIAANFAKDCGFYPPSFTGEVSR